MRENTIFRSADISDAKKLSILFKQVYIHTYGTEGVSDEFANFITKQFSVERLEKLITDRQESLVVAEYNGNLVGAVEIEFEKRCPVDDIVGPELNKLYILDWFCGKGIGEQLLAYAENIVREKGDDLFWLWALETNTRAIRFYEKHGYKVIGHAAFQMEKNSYMNKVMIKRL